MSSTTETVLGLYTVYKIENYNLIYINLQTDIQPIISTDIKCQ